MRRLLATLALAMLGSFPGLSAASGAVPDYTPPPGAINPDVTQSNIAQTICLNGWTATIRPPREFADNLKIELIRQRHLPGGPRDYQLDHWVPLEIGGHPTDRHNLWPQPKADARLKDLLERALHTAVCGSKLTLTAAQQCLLHQATWTACARRMHTPTP
jgi:hypothetical protein